MRIKSFKEHSSYSFKNKEQLDSMSLEEINSYRLSIIQNNYGWSDNKDIEAIRREQSDWKQYINEIDVYILVRFKDRTMRDYERWSRLADEGNKEYELMGNAVKTERGKEVMYSMSLNSDLKKIGEFKYIFMDIEDNFNPDEFASIFK